MAAIMDFNARLSYVKLTQTPIRRRTTFYRVCKTPLSFLSKIMEVLVGVTEEHPCELGIRLYC